MAGDIYLWWKAAHTIGIITWMAGLFYLPRLFVYHAMSPAGSGQSQLLKIMERRLLRGIMHPSLAIVLVTGTVLLPAWWESGWMMAKLSLVGVLIVCHLFYMRWRVKFELDCNTYSHIFYRIVNEIPTVVLVGIVLLVTLKPS